MNFKNWFLVENTVSQMLPSLDPKGEITEIVTTLLKRKSRSAQLFNQSNHQVFIKWCVFWIAKMNKTVPNEPNATETNANSFLAMINDTADFLIHLLSEQPNIAKSKFNNPSYTTNMFNADNKKWHEWLAQQKRKQADPGRKIEIAGMPAGYYWVSLDKGYCDKEGDAMGHCGNAGRKEGDNIFSLRDSKGIPHLTFIVNNQELGESKGVGNEKPSKQYHPHIVAFLLGQDNGTPIVQVIKGGGYRPENNFHFEDLSKELQDKVLAVKPHINDFFKYLNFLSGNNPNVMKSKLEDVMGFEFEKIEEKSMIVKSFEHLSPMIEWLKENTESSLDEVPDFEEGFSMDWDFNTSTQDAIRIFNDDADEKSQKAMEQIIDQLKKDEEEDEDVDYDVEWAAEKNEEIANALRFAAEDGYRYGSEQDAWDHVTKYFKNEEDKDKNGFICRAGMGGSWYIEIGLADLGKLYAQYYRDEADNPYRFTDLIKYKYSQPYNGYSGFDESAYNERLIDLLGEHFDFTLPSRDAVNAQS